MMALIEVRDAQGERWLKDAHIRGEVIIASDPTDLYT